MQKRMSFSSRSFPTLLHRESPVSARGVLSLHGPSRSMEPSRCMRLSRCMAVAKTRKTPVLIRYREVRRIDALPIQRRLQNYHG